MYGLFISILIPVKMYTIIWNNMKYLSDLLTEHRRSKKDDSNLHNLWEHVSDEHVVIHSCQVTSNS